MSWSSGKDSALALHRAHQDPELEVVGMLCTVNADADRVAMHAVRRDLLLAQGDRLGLPIHVTELDINSARGGQRDTGADIAANAGATQGGLVDEAITL